MTRVDVSLSPRGALVRFPTSGSVTTEMRFPTIEHALTFARGKFHDADIFIDGILEPKSAVALRAETVKDAGDTADPRVDNRLVKFADLGLSVEYHLDGTKAKFALTNSTDDKMKVGFRVDAAGKRRDRNIHPNSTIEVAVNNAINNIELLLVSDDDEVSILNVACA